MSIGLSFLAFTLAVSILTLVTAVSLAIRPSERALAVFRPLSVSTVMTVLSSTATGLGLALKTAADAPMVTWTTDMTRRLLAGLAESMVTAVLGFSVLAVSWLLVAFGLRRRI
jgi:uncharacterized membrane protein